MHHTVQTLKTAEAKHGVMKWSIVFADSATAVLTSNVFYFQYVHKAKQQRFGCNALSFDKSCQLVQLHIQLNNSGNKHKQNIKRQR